MAVSEIEYLNTIEAITVTPVTNTTEDYYISTRNNVPEVGVSKCGKIVDVYAIVKVTSRDTTNNHAIITAGMPPPPHDVAFYIPGETAATEPLRVYACRQGGSYAGKLMVRAGTVGATYALYFTYLSEN